MEVQFHTKYIFISVLKALQTGSINVKRKHKN